MDETIFKVSSITYAYKAQDVLKNQGFKAYIERDTKRTSENGCGYVVRVPQDGDKAERILQKYGIRILGRVEKGS